MIASATRGSRRMFLSFCLPLAEFTITCSPSKSHQTGVTCGEPSGMSVPRLAKARLVNRSRYLSGIACDMNPSLLGSHAQHYRTMERLGRGTDRMRQAWRAAPTFIDCVFGGVAFAGDDFVLHIFVLLVLDLQGTAILGNHFDLQLAVSTVELGVGRVVSDGVLVADVATDIFERVNHVAFKAGLVEASAGQFGKRLHLVVSL